MIVSIAANGRDMAFSSDTDMAECLVLARKRPVTAVSEEHLPCEECCDTVLRVEEARFVSLTNRPVNFAQAAQMGRGIITGKHTRRIDDGPFGGTSLLIGEETTGAMIHAICSEDGGPWGAVRMSDYSLAQTAFAMSESRLTLPANHTSLDMTMTTLSDISVLGLYDLDITGKPPQGPFTKMAYSETATYPALWNHNAKREKRIVCVPDSQLHVRSGMESKAAKVWKTAGRSHLNREFYVRFSITGCIFH